MLPAYDDVARFAIEHGVYAQFDRAFETYSKAKWHGDEGVIQSHEIPHIWASLAPSLATEEQQASLYSLLNPMSIPYEVFSSESFGMTSINERERTEIIMSIYQDTLEAFMLASCPSERSFISCEMISSHPAFYHLTRCE